MKAEMFMFIDQVLLAAGAIGVYVWFRRPEQKLKESQDMTLRCFDHLWSVRVLLQYSFFKLSWQPRLQKSNNKLPSWELTHPLTRYFWVDDFCFSPGGICDRSLEGISDLADLDLVLPSWFGTPDFLCRTNRGRAHRLRGKNLFRVMLISGGGFRHFYVQPISIFNQIILCLCHELVVSNVFYFNPYLGKWSNLRNIFFRDYRSDSQKVRSTI